MIYFTFIMCFEIIFLVLINVYILIRRRKEFLEEPELEEVVSTGELHKDNG